MSIAMLLLLLFVQRLTRVFPRCDFSLVIYEETVERLHMIYIYFYYIIYVTKWRIIICIWMWSLREETIYFTPKTKKQYWIIMTYYLLWLGSNLASHPGGKGCVHQPWPGAAAIFFYVDAAHSNPRNQTEKPISAIRKLHVRLRW